MKSIAQVKTFLRNEKDDRERYFNMLKDAANEAETAVIKQRLTMIEDKGKNKESGRFTELLLDMLLAMTYTVGGAVFSAAVNRFVDSIVGTRSKFLWLHRADGKLQAGMVIREGKLHLHPIKASGGAQALEQMKDAEVDAKKKDLGHAAWNLGVEILSDSAVITGIVQDKQDAWPTADARQPRKLVPIIESINGAADAQIAFEKRFMNMLYEMVDETDSIELANGLYESVQSVAMPEDQWKEIKNRYLGVFTTFSWLQYTGDPNNIAWGLGKHQLSQRKGNPLVIKPGTMSIDFASSLTTAHPQLVEHMVKTIIYVKPDETLWVDRPGQVLQGKERVAVYRIEPGLTVWEYFIERKHIIFPEQSKVVPKQSERRAGLSRQAYAELVGLYLIPSLQRVYRMDKDFRKVMDPASLP